MRPRFDHLLIANRGEIALRIIRTARALGYRTAAVYSAADADAPHVAAADHAELIGPANAALSYLAIDRLIAAAQRSGAQAIHPGYGFLSENPAFAEACAAAGIVFVGPTAEAIAAMGNKAEAKAIAEAAGVPCIPGHRGVQDDAAFARAADAIGYPVMVKAAAGGGGRGMRLAESAAGLPDALRLARSEAINAFGSDEMILEKAIVRPRHIEIQVLADEHGNVVHLGGRDCSVQRRHQKIIEEAPPPGLAAATLDAMADMAVSLARAIGYRGVGTVEFIVDEAETVYFIEMNTRLQVEHPVTEAITGLDLVAEQLHVAQGLPLAYAQSDIVLAGHAIEARLYAEDPANGFLPSTGPIDVWSPAAGPGVRIDVGIRQGQSVTPFYDPMVAKIIASGVDRKEALTRLDRAIAETVLLGPETNAAFLRACIGHPTFGEGRATTAFLSDEFPEGLAMCSPPPALVAVAAILFDRADERRAQRASLGVTEVLMGWSNATPPTVARELFGATGTVGVELSRLDSKAYAIRVERGASFECVIADDGAISVDGARQAPVFHIGRNQLQLHDGATAWRFGRADPLQASADDGSAKTHIRAPMHGAVIAVDVREGDVVAPGDRLLVLEAMKMQHELRAEISATVKLVAAQAGSQAAMDALLIELEPAET